MDEQKQQEFIAWLSDKLQAQDQDDLQKKLKTLGDDGIKQAYDQFMSESSDVQSAQEGGKLDYIRCLQAFRHGGAMEMKKCGCGGKMSDGGMLSMKADKRKDVNTKEKNPGKKDWMSKGMKKEHSAVGGIKRHQMGGNVAMNLNKPPAAMYTPEETPHAMPATAPARSTIAQDKDWNRFVGWMQQKGYSGNEQLNHDRNLGTQYMNEYRSQYPDSNLNMDTIKAVQQSVQNVKSYWTKDVANGNASFTEPFMPNASKVDGWLGTKTAQTPFPTNRIVYEGTPQPPITLSDKASGQDNTYHPARNQMQGATPETIKPSWRYAKGGTMKTLPKLTNMKAPASMIAAGNNGARKDSDTKTSNHGMRGDKPKQWITAVGGNGSVDKKVKDKGNGMRKDSNLREKNPGKKDWMSNNKKEWTTAVTKVPKGQAGGSLGAPTNSLIKKKVK